MRRSPAPVLQDRNLANDLVEHEPDATPVLRDLLAHIHLPQAGQAVVLGARLGGLARALAHRHTSWLVTALDPSVALLSASLEAIRPAGLSTQLTVIQAAPETIPLPPASVHAILGDLPLAHLATRACLDAWASACARVLLPGGTLAIRAAAEDIDSAQLGPAMAHWPEPYQRLLHPVWRAAFATAEITESLRRAEFREIAIHPTTEALHGVVRLVVARR